MNPVFADSNTNLNGPAFDLTKCIGKFNTDGGVSLTLAWTPVPNATSYKLIQGGKSGIVLNSIYLNNFIDQTGCFESKLNKTSTIKEYLSTSTSFIISYPASFFDTVAKTKPSFLVYPYFGKIRGPAPYSVLLLEIKGGSTNTNKQIYAKIRPNISVTLIEKNLMLKHNVYEYFNHYKNQKQILTVPLRATDGTYPVEYDENKHANSFGDIGDDKYTLEMATLFYGPLV